MILAAAELTVIREHAVAEYPHEACGVIMATASERRLLRCRNIQNELHARDPERHPRDARTAYYLDPRDLLRIAELERQGFDVAVIYHSHVDAGAYFSPTDRRQALVEGEPTYPAAVYVVASVMEGALAAVAGFRWSAEARDFVPVDLAEAAAGNEEHAR
jgi:proteasome lid subunit RPN8/RPN11